MQNKYCLPIIKSSFSEVIKTIEASEADYGYFEIWLDYIDKLKISELINLTERYPGKIVLVVRRQNLEPIRMPIDKRLELLKSISEMDILVDFDISQQSEELEEVKDKGLILNKIVSFHDYRKTPELEELRGKISEMETYEPDIVKISTFCNTKQDALRLLMLQQELSGKNKKHIALGMGENGLITRIFGTLWGNTLAFVPENAEDQSAEGQITREKIERIMKELTE